jgi:hypothetical protein
MSLFGDVDDNDRRRKQRQNLSALTTLVQLGAKQKLPPLNWRLPEGYGTLCGEVGIFHERHRETFEAWHAALSKLRRVEPGKLGFRSDGAPRAEGTRDGKTWMIAVFKLRLTEHTWPVCEFVIQAEWYEDEPAEATR